MLCSPGVTKTIFFKTPGTDKVRKLIVTSVRSYTSESVLPAMENRVCRPKRRLDHLSIEEKIMRKKLKNREAAQTSRDRKKARFEELETTILHLQNENDSLHDEVHSLKDEKESLLQENARLTEEVWRLSVVGGASGSAVSCPLPKGVIPPPALPHSFLQHCPARLLRLLSLLLIHSMTGTGLTMCRSLPLSKNLKNLLMFSSLKLMSQNKQKQRKRAWWGRKQKAWNPVGPA